MIQIDELILKVSGLTEEESGSLGREVAGRVSDGLPGQQEDRHINALNIKVNVPHGTSRSKMANLIAEAILKGLV